jgi:hypothetical protein
MGTALVFVVVVVPVLMGVVVLCWPPLELGRGWARVCAGFGFLLALAGLGVWVLTLFGLRL